MPAGFTLRNRVRFEFVRPEQVLRLSRTGLAASGLAVASITARAVDPGANGLAGMVVVLDGDAPHDRTPPCNRDADPLCAGDPVFDDYSIEVVQRIGYDSFTPDSGVLIAKNKDREGASCGYNCFTWVIDAHPEDMKALDFTRPDGTRVMRTVADYRQLNDALFHAGVGSSSQYEWEDAANRLHFYVIDLQRDANGVLSYVVAARSLDGAGSQSRGVAATAPAASTITGAAGTVTVGITNTGGAGTPPAALHPRAPVSAFASDVYRLSVSIDGSGWTADVLNVLTAVRSGETATIPISVRRTAAGGASARLTVTATSESDPGRKATAATTLTAK